MPLMIDIQKSLHVKRQKGGQRHGPPPPQLGYATGRLIRSIRCRNRFSSTSWKLLSSTAYVKAAINGNGPKIRKMRLPKTIFQNTFCNTFLFTSLNWLNKFLFTSVNKLG